MAGRSRCTPIRQATGSRPNELPTHELPTARGTLDETFSRHAGRIRAARDARAPRAVGEARGAHPHPERHGDDRDTRHARQHRRAALRRQDRAGGQGHCGASRRHGDRWHGQVRHAGHHRSALAHGARRGE